MLRCLFSSLVCLLLFSCTEAVLPELDANLLAPDAPPSFTLLTTEFSSFDEARVDATLFFHSVYAQLNTDQQEQITGIELTSSTGAIDRVTMEATATSVTVPGLRVGQRYCLSLRFLTRMDNAHPVEFCVTPE